MTLDPLEPNDTDLTFRVGSCRLHQVTNAGPQREPHITPAGPRGEPVMRQPAPSVADTDH